MVTGVQTCALPISLDQNIAASVALIANIRENFAGYRKNPAIRQHIRYSIQALRVLRNLRAE
jgi:hypothetical protein